MRASTGRLAAFRYSGGQHNVEHLVLRHSAPPAGIFAVRRRSRKARGGTLAYFAALGPFSGPRELD